MKISNTNIEGLFFFENPIFKDARGEFNKPFSFDAFTEYELRSDFKEFYYSQNRRNVIRGMHFQTPPFEHVKVVYVSSGSVIDVVLDLRHMSRTYGQYFSIELSSENGCGVYIPIGCAHGFRSLASDTIVNYAQTSCYSKDCDCGVRFDSFGFNWGISNPILSERDTGFVSFKEYRTVF